MIDLFPQCQGLPTIQYTKLYYYVCYYKLQQFPDASEPVTTKLFPILKSFNTSFILVMLFPTATLFTLFLFCLLDLTVLCFLTVYHQLFLISFFSYICSENISDTYLFIDYLIVSSYLYCLFSSYTVWIDFYLCFNRIIFKFIYVVIRLFIVSSSSSEGSYCSLLSSLYSSVHYHQSQSSLISVPKSTSDRSRVSSSVSFNKKNSSSCFLTIFLYVYPKPFGYIQNISQFNSFMSDLTSTFSMLNKSAGSLLSSDVAKVVKKGTE